MIARWSAELAGFHFEIRHKKGTANLAADAISRWGDDPEVATEEELVEGAQYVHALAPITPWSDQTPKIPVTRANLICLQKSNLITGRVRDIL